MALALRKTTLRAFGAPLVMTGMVILAPLSAYAQDNAAPDTSLAPQTVAPEQEVWQIAQEYSLKNVELVIVINGRNKKYTVEQLGAGYQKMFKNLGVAETSVWTDLPNKYGSGVMFMVDGELTSSNILNVKEAAEHVPEAADMFKEHAPIMHNRLAKSKQASLGDGGTTSTQVTTVTMTIQPQNVQSMTFDEIKKDKAFMKDRVILHYGSGIVDVDLVAEVLSESGTPAIAISGGPNCGIRLIISGVSNEKFCFTQDHLDLGEVGGLAERMLPRIMKKQAQQRLPQTHDSLNLDN